MAQGGLKELEGGITNKLQGMISRGKSVSAYFNRNLFEQFKQAQNERWQTENASQGAKWAPLNPRYKALKLKKYASFPGGGKAIMVATGRLAQGALAQNSSYYYKAVTEKSFVLGINLGALPYAKYPGTMRPYMSFSKETMDLWRKGLTDYISKGKP